MTIAVLIAAACLASGCSSPRPAEPIEACSATDGDTLRCGEERIRLLGIDAPEMPGHCRRGRICAPGDPVAAKAALAAAISGKALSIRRAGRDRYGRTLGVVYAGPASSSGAVGGRDAVNLSCSQVAGRHAIYVRKWDDGAGVRTDCPGVTDAA